MAACSCVRLFFVRQFNEKGFRHLRANKCVFLLMVCQSEGSLAGGVQDSDVKLDTVAAGKFTAHPLSHRHPLGAVVLVGMWLIWPKFCRLSAFQGVQLHVHIHSFVYYCLNYLQISVHFPIIIRISLSLK